MSERIRVWDVVLIVALVAACASVLFFPRSAGQTATVRVNGEIRAVLPLSQDTQMTLEDGTVVIVEKGTVRVEHSTCPDHLCESVGKIGTEGQTILCLPNRISVVISGEEADVYAE